MNQPAIVCHPDDRADKAVSLMGEYDCGVIPIVNADYKVVGAITDRDICMAASAQRMPIHTMTIRDAMTSRVITCRPDDTLETAVSRMKRARVHRLPVVGNDDRIVGVISTNDIFREVSAHRNQHSLSDRILVEMLAAICAPHRPVQIVKAADTQQPQGA